MSSAALRSATVTAAVVVLAKEPVPGRVKTRLQTRFSPAESAALARAAIGDTFDAVATTFRGRTFAAWDGTGRDDVPADVPVVPQSAGSLDHRIEAALADAMRATTGPVVLVGMDTPQLDPTDLDVDWSSTDAVLGLTPDGGFWAIGLAGWVPDCVAGVPMSTPSTGRAQLARLRGLGLRVTLLPEIEDIDTPEVAQRVADRWPALRFSRLHRQLAAP